MLISTICLTAQDTLHLQTLRTTAKSWRKRSPSMTASNHCRPFTYFELGGDGYPMHQPESPPHVWAESVISRLGRWAGGGDCQMRRWDYQIEHPLCRNPESKWCIEQLTCLLPPGIRIRMATDIMFNYRVVIHYGRAISNLIHLITRYLIRCRNLHLMNCLDYSDFEATLRI